MKKKRTQLNIIISPVLLESLKKKSIKSGLTLGTFLNNLLESYIENEDENDRKSKSIDHRLDLLEKNFEKIKKKISEENAEKSSIDKTIINDELAERYTQLIREDFQQTKRDLMIPGNEIMEMLLDTEIGREIKQKDINIFKDVVTEECNFTGQHLQYLIDEYGTLPCFAAIEAIKPNPKLQSICKEIGIY
tara:strand:- start:2364 stop:2936 length:573 start_codon:yes stop_codon:yes gene_type:complete